MVISDRRPPENSQIGDAICFVKDKRNELVRCYNPYDPSVFGVVVRDSLDNLAIAVGGEVYVNVDRSSADIAPGDWVVPSGASGKITRADESFPFKVTILGASLEAWSANDTIQKVKVLLMPGEKITLPKSQKPASEGGR